MEYFHIPYKNRQTQTQKSYVYFIYFFYIYGQLLMDLSFFSVLDTETLNSAENHKQSVLESSALKQHSSCCLESLWTLNCALTSPHVPVDWEDCWAESFQYCLKSLFFSLFTSPRCCFSVLVKPSQLCCFCWKREIKLMAYICLYSRMLLYLTKMRK